MLTMDMLEIDENGGKQVWIIYNNERCVRQITWQVSDKSLYWPFMNFIVESTIYFGGC